ncbi:MAG TPA: sensor histidine kinase [Thermoleophilaceae bacterium]|nr:sensor histidine kinase [Thermoleophilaceae bacterium]
MPRPRLRHRDDSLIGQVIGANVVLVTLTLLAASLAAGLDISIAEQRWQFLILALAIVLTLCVNLWMLQKRFDPLERLVERLEAIDPAEPATFELGDDPTEEIGRLASSFRRLLRRVDDERRRSGKLVLRGQEEERRRVARDLHDEVNQALTGILLRLEALAQDLPVDGQAQVAELKQLTGQAMDELLALARQLRPTALDDHGLAPAIDAQARGFAKQTGVEASFAVSGDPSRLDEETQTVVYRVAQEALSNAAQHARPGRIDIELDAGDDGAVVLRVRDDGEGFDPLASRAGGLGLEGMAERARLAGGELDLRSERGAGTELTLRLP